MLQNSHRQLLTNLQATSSLHKLHSQILTNKLSHLLKQENWPSLTNTNQGLIQYPEQFKNHKEALADEEEVEKQMKIEYMMKINQLQAKKKELQIEISMMRESRVKMQVKRLAVVDIVKQREVKLLQMRRKIKEKEVEIAFSGIDKLLEPHLIHTNDKTIEHLKNRIQNSRKAAIILKQQIKSTIKNNQYLQNLISTKLALKNKYALFQDKSNQLQQLLEKCKSQAIRYVRESEEDISKIVEKEMPKALDAKFRSKDQLSNAYNCLYEIISKEVMEGGKYEMFNLVQGIEQI